MTTLMLPYAVTLIPTFLVWSKLGLVNTFWPLIVPSWFGGHIFFIFLLRQFFRGIPRDLDEAALIDGANPLRILWDIVLPLSRPALISVVIFSSLSTWNDFLHPLIYLNDDRKFTLALGLAQFRGLYNSEWHLLMAASMLVVAPVLLLFVVAQRYFVEGIALTGIKG
jgi:multiple sugar transport system permease protein